MKNEMELPEWINILRALQNASSQKIRAEDKRVEIKVGRRF